MNDVSAGRDITINFGISEQQFQLLSERFCITNAALRRFFKIFQENPIQIDDLDSKLHEIAQRYNKLREELQQFRSDDPVAAGLRKDAAAAMESGEFDRAEQILNTASERDIEASETLKEVIIERLLSAAAAKAQNGDLKLNLFAYAQAADYYSSAIKLVPEDREVALAKYLDKLGSCLVALGDYDNGKISLTKGLEIRERVLGPSHPDVAESLMNTATLHHLCGRNHEAIPFNQRAIAILEAAFGPEHDNVAVGLNNLAAVYYELGRYIDTEPLYQRSLSITERAVGKDHSDT